MGLLGRGLTESDWRPEAAMVKVRVRGKSLSFCFSLPTGTDQLMHFIKEINYNRQQLFIRKLLKTRCVLVLKIFRADDTEV